MILKHFVLTVGLCCNPTLAVADSDQPYVSNSAIFNIENSSLYNKNNQFIEKSPFIKVDS